MRFRIPKRPPGTTAAIAVTLLGCIPICPAGQEARSAGGSLRRAALPIYESYGFKGAADYDVLGQAPRIASSSGQGNESSPEGRNSWRAEWGEAQQVYFHSGVGFAQPQAQALRFQGNGNCGVYWGITLVSWGPADAQRASQLEFLESGLGQPAPSPPLPISWELSEDGGRTWMPGTWAGGVAGQNWGYWWLLNSGHPGQSSWMLRITTNPNPRQADGRYVLHAQISSKPVL